MAGPIDSTLDELETRLRELKREVSRLEAARRQAGGIRIPRRRRVLLARAPRRRDQARTRPTARIRAPELSAGDASPVASHRVIPEGNGIGGRLGFDEAQARLSS
jgi:hypothetical protein